MRNEHNAVKQFHTDIAGAPIGKEFPTEPHKNRRLHSIIRKLGDLVKELEDLRDANPEDIEITRIELCMSEPYEMCKALVEGDKIEFADGIADSLYVILGNGVTYGMSCAALFWEIHRSNMTKRPMKKEDEGVRVKDKGLTYSPPDLDKILELGTSFEDDDQSQILASINEEAREIFEKEGPKGYYKFLEERRKQI